MRSAVCRLEILATRALAIADELRGESGPARMLAALLVGARISGGCGEAFNDIPNTAYPQ